MGAQGVVAGRPPRRPHRAPGARGPRRLAGSGRGGGVVCEAAEAGDKDATELALRKATKGLDKAASKGVIHKNQAANRKSSLATLAASV